MRRTVLTYTIALLAIATALGYVLAPWYGPRTVEAFVGGFLVAIAFQWWAGMALWKRLRRVYG
jgi:hypothetical protein